MKAIIHLKFEKIKGQEVDRALLEKNPRLTKSTARVVSNLCMKIEEYFKMYKIKVNSSFEMNYDR